MGNGVAVHPAWQCAQRKLTNVERWNDREAGMPGGYFDSQIALAMIVGGFGADVIVTERDEEGNPLAYKFPDVWVVINEDAGRRMGPARRFLQDAHGDGDRAYFPISARGYALNGRG